MQAQLNTHWCAHVKFVIASYYARNAAKEAKSMHQINEMYRSV
jgi:hypothetical protein